MKVQTGAVLVIRWAEMVPRWHRPVGRYMYERRRQGRCDVRYDSR